MGELEDEVRRAFRVTGQVQGVGYRAWTRTQAHALGLRGTVRNCPDGTVEVDASGPANAVARLRAILLAGPPAASVEQVEELQPREPALPPDFRVAG